MVDLLAAPNSATVPGLTVVERRSREKKHKRIRSAIMGVISFPSFLWGGGGGGGGGAGGDTDFRSNPLSRNRVSAA